jgi:putative phosphoesterase
MKVALLGDIHANEAALQAVIRAADDERVETFLVTGDLVGYYFQPARVLELLRQVGRPVHVVRGNHEEMLRMCRDDPSQAIRIRVKYGSGIDLALHELTGQDYETLVTLPHPQKLRVGMRDVLLSHGAPHSVDKYIYPDADEAALVACAAPATDLVVMGHTHYPFSRAMGQTILVNPGSVGQPRNGARGACWALYDTQTGQVNLCVTPYDALPLINECRQRHPELPYLWEVLVRS